MDKSFILIPFVPDIFENKNKNKTNDEKLMSTILNIL